MQSSTRGELKGQSSIAAYAKFAVCVGAAVAFELPRAGTHISHTHTYHSHTHTVIHVQDSLSLCMSRVFAVHDGLIKSRFSFPFCRCFRFTLREIFIQPAAFDFGRKRQKKSKTQTKTKSTL